MLAKFLFDSKFCKRLGNMNKFFYTVYVHKMFTQYA